MTFAEKVITIRETKKLSGTELGEMLEVGKSTIHNYESGKTIPQDPVIRRKIEIWFSEIEETQRKWDKVYGMKRRRVARVERYRKKRDRWG